MRRPPRLDVVAAREIELLVVQPPRHVEVRAAGAVLVVRHAVHQPRNEAADARAGRVGQVLADVPLEFPRPCGNFDDFELSRMRADSHALAGHDDDARADVVFAARAPVDIGDAVGEAAASTVTSRAIALEGSSAGRSSSPAGAAPTARRSSSASRSRGRTGRSSGTPAGRRAAASESTGATARWDVQPRRGPLDQQLVAARRRRRQEDAVGLVGELLHLAPKMPMNLSILS